MASANQTMGETPREMEDALPDWGWKSLMALGVLMLAGGIVAFFNPFAASLTVELVAGFAFGVAGAMQLWMAFMAQAPTTGERWLIGGLGVLLLLLAVSLLANPLAGLLTLTIMVAVLFAMMGVLRIFMAFQQRPREGWGWMTASGVMSLLLAVLIGLGLPNAALGILGLFLGIDLTFSGVATIMVAWQVRKHQV